MSFDATAWMLKSEGFRRAEAESWLRGKEAKTIRSIYDRGPASVYLSELLPTFEYPDWDYRTVGDFLRHVARRQASA